MGGLSRARVRGTTDCGLPPSAEDTAMPSTRGKKRSPPETQKRNVNPRVGETREVTIASGYQKGQKKTQKLQHTPGGTNKAWANEPCTKCTGSRRCANCKDQMKKAFSKARQKGKKAAAAAAAESSAPAVAMTTTTPCSKRLSLGLTPGPLAWSFNVIRSRWPGPRPRAASAAGVEADVEAE